MNEGTCLRDILNGHCALQIPLDCVQTFIHFFKFVCSHHDLIHFASESYCKRQWKWRSIVAMDTYSLIHLTHWCRMMVNLLTWCFRCPHTRFTFAHFCIHTFASQSAKIIFDFSCSGFDSVSMGCKTAFIHWKPFLYMYINCICEWLWPSWNKWEQLCSDREREMWWVCLNHSNLGSWMLVHLIIERVYAY